MEETATQIVPPTSTQQWALLLAFPLFCLAIGVIYLPDPKPVSDAREDVDRGDLGPVVSKTAPNPGVKIGAVLGDRLEMVGADLPQRVSIGSTMALTFYFKALKSIDRNWQVFLHIDHATASHRIHGDHYPADGRYQTTLWQKDEFVTDRFEKRVPFDAPKGKYDVFLGFYIGNERMPFTSGDAKYNAGQNRIKVGSFVVD